MRMEELVGGGVLGKAQLNDGLCTVYIWRAIRLAFCTRDETNRIETDLPQYTV